MVYNGNYKLFFLFLYVQYEFTLLSFTAPRAAHLLRSFFKN